MEQQELVEIIRMVQKEFPSFSDIDALTFAEGILLAHSRKNGSVLNIEDCNFFRRIGGSELYPNVWFVAQTECIAVVGEDPEGTRQILEILWIKEATKN